MRRNTKIIATLGPASGDRDTIHRLIRAGLDVVRLNFSHGSYDTHQQWTEWVREAAETEERAIAVLQDVQGPRIRVGTFPGGHVDLATGQSVKLRDGDGSGTDGVIFVQHLADAGLHEGSRVLLADGMVVLSVTDSGNDEYQASVVEGGRVGDHKGAAFPGTALGLPAVTGKDERDLAYGKELGVDLVAASFVTSGADIDDVRACAGDVPVIAKIERVAAYENLDDILDSADGAMVARGDLGVELGFEPLPRAQKEIIRKTNEAGAISITATEMLESMTTSPRPSRAEVTDVANAVLDGTDAVMLSGETAVGRFPIRVVEVMSAICIEAESGGAAERGRVAYLEDEQRIASAIAQSTADTANSLGLKTVVAFTESGKTALLLSKYRPNATIVAFTPEPGAMRRMALYWGVLPKSFPRLDSTDEMIAEAERLLLAEGLVEPGERIAMAAGIPPNQAASTNLLKLHEVVDSA